MIKTLIIIQTVEPSRPLTFGTGEYKVQSQPKWNVIENHWESGTNRNTCLGTAPSIGRTPHHKHLGEKQEGGKQALIKTQIHEY